MPRCARRQGIALSGSRRGLSVPGAGGVSHFGVKAEARKRTSLSPEQATSGDVQRRNGCVLQARGHRPDHGVSARSRGLLGKCQHEWLEANHLAAGMAPMVSSSYSIFLFNLVGRTGFEPVTFSVSGRRAPAAPTARDVESLPDSGSGGVHHGELRWRAIQVLPAGFATPPTQASIRGSPNRAMVLLSTNRVTAEIRSPDSVSTIIPCARNTWAWSSCR